MSYVNDNSFLLFPVDTSFTEEALRNIIEDHLVSLKNAPDTVIHYLQPVDTYRYENNLYGYLNTITNISQHENIYWVIARLNGMLNSSDFGPKHTQLYIPDMGRIQQIYLLERTKQKN